MKPASRRLSAALQRSLTVFRHDTQGTVAVLAAVTLCLVFILLAVAVDGASLHLQRRHAQSMVDLAAISAAANQNDPEAGMRRFLQDNGVDGFHLTIADQENTNPFDGPSVTTETVNIDLLLGNYVPDEGTSVQNRFQSGAGHVNAAKVTWQQNGVVYFADTFLDFTPLIRTTAVAYADVQAAFSIGSRLAKVEGGILNAFLNGVLGTNLSLSVADYRSLIDADIDAFAFLDAIATSARLEAGTYDQLLASDVSVGDIASALASVAEPGDSTAADAALSIAGNSGAGASIPLSHLFDLGPLGGMAVGSGGSVMAARVGMMDVLMATAGVAHGKHQIELDLATSIPGLTSLTVDLAIGEPPNSTPWFGIGSRGKVVRTAQVRLYVLARIGGTGALSGVTIRLPLFVELAYGEAVLDRLSCPTGRVESARVDLDARSGVADIWIADIDLNNLGRFDRTVSPRKAELLKTSLLSVTGQAHAEIGNTTYQRLNFDYDDIRNGTYRTVSTSQFSQTLASSLVQDLNLDVNALGLGISLPPGDVKKLVLDAVTPVAEELDDAIYQLLSALGVKVGQADVWVNGAACQRAVLVQ